MRNLIIIVLLAVCLFPSCKRSVTCSEPDVFLDYKIKTNDTLFISYDTLYITFESYEKGSQFSKQTSMENDTVYKMYNGYWTTITKHVSLNKNYDYKIIVLNTGKTYEVSNIHYDGITSTKDGSFGFEKGTICHRESYYTLNGKECQVKSTVCESKCTPTLPRFDVTK